MALFASVRAARWPALRFVACRQHLSTTSDLTISPSTAACVPAVLKQLAASGALGDEASVPGDSQRSEADLAKAVQQNAATKCMVVYDLDALRGAFNSARSAFPAHFVHALAIKSAPMSFVLKEAIQAGCGIEAASFGEAASAVEHGCPRQNILFDSPAKTVAELRWALELGLTVNADNMFELSRIDTLIKERKGKPSASIIGLRVNPIVDGGEISMFAVSSPDSKFGHPLHTAEARAEVIGAFRSYPWLSSLHAHVGSAGTSLQMLSKGIASLVELANEVDRDLGGDARVTTLDIGGGLAASSSFAEYAQVLRGAAPDLFSNTRRRVFTEFGRAMTSKSGLVVTQVEYVKTPLSPHSPLRIATCHAGADLLLRECYNPQLYSHDISAYDAHGRPLAQVRAGAAPHHLAGPLCFAGDYIKKDVSLPPLEPGDLVVVHDTGANSLSLWSRHCSRLVPPVYGFSRQATSAGNGSAGGEVNVQVELQKPPEPLERLLEFWR